MFNTKLGFLVVLLSFGAQPFAQAEKADDQPTRVEVPDSLKDRGKLLVVGKAGAEQSENFTYYRCRSSMKEGVQELSRNSCGEAKAGTLNEAQSLVVGSYLVFYSHSAYTGIVNIRKNETTTLKLQKILVPAVRKADFNYRAFRDLTAENEQEKLARFYWGTQNNNWAIWFCNEKEEREKLGREKGERNEAFINYCEAARTSDFATYQKKYIRFGQNGNFGLVTFKYDTDSFQFSKMPYYNNEGFIEITDPRDGNFISVFPGTYILVFTDADGESVSQFGVQVKD